MIIGYFLEKTFQKIFFKKIPDYQLDLAPCLVFFILNPCKSITDTSPAPPNNVGGSRVERPLATGDVPCLGCGARAISGWKQVPKRTGTDRYIQFTGCILDFQVTATNFCGRFYLGFQINLWRPRGGRPKAGSNRGNFFIFSRQKV